jgi:hypothetical protein
MTAAAAKSLAALRAEMEERWLAAIVRQMNLRYEVSVCDREIAAIERRIEMLKGNNRMIEARET